MQSMGQDASKVKGILHHCQQTCKITLLLDSAGLISHFPLIFFAGTLWVFEGADFKLDR